MNFLFGMVFFMVGSVTSVIGASTSTRLRGITRGAGVGTGHRHSHPGRRLAGSGCAAACVFQGPGLASFFKKAAA